MTTHADYIIVGGGTGGLTIAHQIASRTTFTVVVLEAGDDWTQTDPNIKIPFNSEVVATNPSYEWGITSAPQINAGNTTIPVGRFKGLGGCSQHNGCGFWMANRHSYDNWPTGFKQIDFQRAAQQYEGCASFGFPNHGTSGPLYTKLDNLDATDIFLSAYKQATLNSGIVFSADENDADARGYMPHLTVIKDGERAGPYKVFKDFLATNPPNLTVIKNALVTKIMFKSKNNIMDPSVVDGVSATIATQTRKFKVAKGVILSAGVYHSPQLLMVSGVGNESELSGFGIQSKINLEGVGKNLKDHTGIPYIFRAKQSSPINDDNYLNSQYLQYISNKTGYLAYPFLDHSATTIASNGDQTGATLPDVAFATGPYQKFATPDPLNVVVLALLLDPKSSGSVKLSGPSVLTQPIVDFNVFSDPTDLITLKNSLNVLRGILSQPSFSMWHDYEISPSGATDADIKQSVLIGDHGMGTCKMGESSDSQAVVNNKGKVFKTTNLYVADASVIPTTGGATPNASTHATVILLAKLIADSIILENESWDDN